MDKEISTRALARLLDVSSKTIAAWAADGHAVYASHPARFPQGRLRLFVAAADAKRQPDYLCDGIHARHCLLRFCDKVFCERWGQAQQ